MVMPGRRRISDADSAPRYRDAIRYCETRLMRQRLLMLRYAMPRRCRRRQRARLRLPPERRTRCARATLRAARVMPVKDHVLARRDAADDAIALF